MTFSAAIAVMRKGGHVYRQAWTSPRSQWQHAGNEGTPVLSLLAPQGNRSPGSDVLRHLHDPKAGLVDGKLTCKACGASVTSTAHDGTGKVKPGTFNDACPARNNATAKADPVYAETIILRNEIGEAYIWGPGQASILAEDWEVMFEAPEGAK